MPDRHEMALCHAHGVDMSKMTRQEIEALLRLLTEWERWYAVTLNA